MAQPISRAEKFSTDRGRTCLLFSVVSLCWTSILVGQIEASSVRGLSVLVWALWLLVPFVWVFGRPGWRKWSERERGIINDELAREHQRAAAMSAMMVLIAGLGAGCLQLLSYVDLPASWPVAVIGIGVCTAGMHFGWLQVRATR